MAKKLDKETEKVFTKGEHLKALVESSGWGIAREMLLKKVAGLLNMKDLTPTSTDPHNLALLIGIHQETAKKLMEWLQDVESEVDQHKTNINLFDEVTDDHILRFDEPSLV